MNLPKLDFNDPVLLFSQLLSLAIVGGSVLLKLPQVLKIVKAGNTVGVSEMTTAMELFTFLTSFLYGYVKQLPLDTYAETGICGVQVALIYLMLMVYNRKLFSPLYLLYIVGLAAYSYSFLDGQFNQKLTLPVKQLSGLPIYELLYLSLAPIGAASKLPQIVTFYKEKSTGNAAFLTWFLGFGGSAARVFTTWKQTGDILMTANYAVSSFFGAIIVLQFFIYWNSTKVDSKKKEEKKKQ